MKLAVYGASGYQGRLVLEELQRRGIDAALVGRSAERLRAAAAGDADVRVAAIGDAAALAAAFRGCDAVINCAGPFTLTAEAVVAAAIAARCHYVDTSGEQLSIKRTFDRFAAPASDACVTVVPVANDGGLADLLAALLAERLGDVRELTTAHRLTGEAFSRGSMRSALASADVFATGGLVFADGRWRDGEGAAASTFTFPGDHEPVPVVTLAAPEIVTIPRHLSVGRLRAVVAAEWLGAVGNLTAELIEQLPEGPTPEQRRAGTFTIAGDAVAAGGRHARGAIHGRDSYGITAVIAVEAARRLIEGAAASGVLAPAQAFDPAGFLAFLAAHGVRWSMEAPVAAPG